MSKNIQTDKVIRANLHSMCSIDVKMSLSWYSDIIYSTHESGITRSTDKINDSALGSFDIGNFFGNFDGRKQQQRQVEVDLFSKDFSVANYFFIALINQGKNW